MKARLFALHTARLASALSLLLGAALPQTAWSQAPALASVAAPAPASATQRETARAWWHEGQALFKQKDYASALERFTAAYGLMRVPTVGIELARTQAAMGKWVEANASAMEVLNMPVVPDEPKVFARARDHAQELRARLTPLIPALRIEVTPAGIPVQVEIDGEPLTVPGQKLSFRLNPGGHELLVKAGGYLTARRTVALRQKEHQTLSITLVAEPAPVAPSTPPPPSTDELFGKDPPSSARGGSAAAGPSTLGYVALGTAGTAALVGSITGTLAFTTKPSCPNGRCRLEQRKEGDASLRFGNIATVSFGVAIAAGVYGLWDWLAHGSPEASTGEQVAKARVTPLSSGALLEVSGSF